MKPHTLPVKRRRVTHGFLRRLNAVTGNRKQRAAAASAAELEADNIGSKISRVLTVIFLVHIVVIGLLFVHVRFLEGRPGGSAASVKAGENGSADSGKSGHPAKAVVENATPAVMTQRSGSLPRLSAGEKPYIVKAGDNYSRIAANEGVNEGDLRTLNQHVDIGPGLILKIPPKRIVAEDPPEVAAIRAQTPSDKNRGLVEAVDVSDAPKAHPVHVTSTPRATSSHQAATRQTSSGKSYVVQPGDSIVRIASKHNVSKAALMRANGITDTHKMKPGMKLVIPQK